MAEDPYHDALRSTLSFEEDDDLEHIRNEFPGVQVSKTYIQSNSAGGVTRYAAIWHGYAVTAFSASSLQSLLRDMDRLPEGS